MKYASGPTKEVVVHLRGRTVYNVMFKSQYDDNKIEKMNEMVQILFIALHFITLCRYGSTEGGYCFALWLGH